MGFKILKPTQIQDIFYSQDKKGMILVFALLILGIMIFLGAYFLTFSLTGFKMTRSQETATKAYYLAEAGIQEAIFKLKNDPVWKSAFETQSLPTDPHCSSWSISPYSRNPALFPGGSYDVLIENLGCAKAQITSIAKIAFPTGFIAQRIVKTKVFKAVGNAVSEYSVFTGGPSENIDISAVNPLNIYGGSLFSNNNIKIKFWSGVNVENKALARGNILLSDSSQLTATSCATNVCDAGCPPSDCPPAEISMPPLDLDSVSPSSYLSQAKNNDCRLIRADGKSNCVFTPQEFEAVMWAYYPTLSLPSDTIVYVTGDANVRAGQELLVNGVLAADRDINLGQDYCWTRSEPPYLRCGFSTVAVNRTGDDLPAGLLAKRKMNVGGMLGVGVKALDVYGLLYSGDEMRLSSVGAYITIQGGIATRKFTLSSLWNGVDIYLDSDVIVDTFGNPSYSPVITIDHWEEEY